MTRPLEMPDLDNLLRRYVAGESVNKLARENGFSRTAFNRQLRVAGIARRDQSAAETAKWAALGAQERSARMYATYSARRGKPDTAASKRKRAITREAAGFRIAHAQETGFAKRMEVRGVPLVAQKAFGFWNVDLAHEETRVAVEVFGGQFHTSQRHAARHVQRMKYILDQGWAVLIIWVNRLRHPLGVGAEHYLAAFIDEMRGNVASRRQYRVIGGHGKPMPIAKSYLNTRAIIRRFRPANDVGTPDLLAG